MSTETVSELSLMDRAIEASRLKDFARATELAREALAADPSLANGRHENLFRMLAHGAMPEHVARLAPARLNTLVHSGWLHSLYSGAPVNADGEPLPWITQPAIDFLEQKIRPDWNVLEWGCGTSTLWWAKRVRQVVSIEHNPDWQRQTLARAPINTTVHLVEQSDRYAEASPVSTEERFDVSVIDGEHRNHCARSAAERTRPSGIILFDNSDRSSAADGISFLMKAGWLRIDFVGLMPMFAYRSCTSIFLKDVSLLQAGPLPCETRSSLGPTIAQVLAE